MSNICINTLIGIPASGKSTFCRQMQSEAKMFNVIHICYDDFIQMPDDCTTESSHYFQSKPYKKQRFSLLWLMQQMIDDIKGNTEFANFRKVLLTEFPHVNFNHNFVTTNENYLLLVDDTMHYKSMRKELRTLARNHELGYFVTYFHSTIDKAIYRNQNRVSTLNEKHLKRIFDILERPTNDDGEIINIDIDDDYKITTEFVELFALKCINHPLKLIHSVNNPPIEQSIIHRVDLILRKSINGRMEKCKKSNVSMNLSEFAKVLCAKRLFVLNEIKMGRIVLPENVDDLSFLID